MICEDDLLKLFSCVKYGRGTFYDLGFVKCKEKKKFEGYNKSQSDIQPYHSCGQMGSSSGAALSGLYYTTGGCHFRDVSSPKSGNGQFCSGEGWEWDWMGWSDENMCWKYETTLCLGHFYSINQRVESNMQTRSKQREAAAHFETSSAHPHARCEPSQTMTCSISWAQTDFVMGSWQGNIPANRFGHCPFSHTAPLEDVWVEVGVRTGPNASRVSRASRGARS